MIAYVALLRAVNVGGTGKLSMAEVLANNPFFYEARNRTLAIFLDEAPPSDTLSTLSGQKDEVVRLGRCETCVRYGDGMGTSTLKIPAAKIGTARNMNTIAKLAAMAAEI